MLKILQGGKLIRTDWDPETKSYKTTNVDNTLPYLCTLCELEAGVKFKDILALVRNDCELYSYLLTSGPWLKELVEEGDKPFIDECDSVTHLEVYWAAEISNYNGVDELTNYTSIHGMGEGGPYAIDFSPINILTELEVRLNLDYKIYDMRDYTKTVPILSAKKEFTLLEILRGIFWELSFHGSAENRDARAASIKQSVEDIESGLVKTIPWEGWDKMMEHEDCKRCNGEGWLLDFNSDAQTHTTRHTCDWCGGTGQEPSPPDRDRDELSVEED